MGKSQKKEKQKRSRSRSPIHYKNDGYSRFRSPTYNKRPEHRNGSDNRQSYTRQSRDASMSKSSQHSGSNYR